MYREKNLWVIGFAPNSGVAPSPRLGNPGSAIAVNGVLFEFLIWAGRLLKQPYGGPYFEFFELTVMLAYDGVCMGKIKR